MRHRPARFDHAEYWSVNPYIVKAPPEGAGFDTTLTDGLRIAIRDVIGNASAPDERPLNMTALAQSLWPDGIRRAVAFRAGAGKSRHRLSRDGNSASRGWAIRSIRVPGLPAAGPRVATGLSLTAPGIPMLFMGQEFLEDKQWADDFVSHRDLLLHWAGLDQGDTQMLDHLRCIRELLGIRRVTPGLRGQGFRVVHAHDQNRLLVFHRWVPGEGRDVMVAAHLANFTRVGYRIGFPDGGAWRELFNSDVYESWVNAGVMGNGGLVVAEPQPLHGFGYSASVVLPANSLLVFSR